MQALSTLANTRLGVQLGGRYRIGIDSGLCIAVRGGRGAEPEPLFVGHAANYAAKLAEGTDPGIFVSDTVEQILRGQALRSPIKTALLVEGRATFDATSVADILTASVDETASTLMESWQADIRAGRAPTLETFAFHYHQPPLKTIDYSKLMPSNSIRMPLISVFADIAGYTKYVQSAMAHPMNAANAVRNLHVIRGEMAAVLREDFEGKKVRFVGDCIHGLFAYGNSGSVDEMDTISRAVHLTGAIRSSFDLCKQNLSGIETLGLAIGFELGATPVSRVGIRGDRSVRVAVSKTTAISEERQSVSDGVTTAIGPKALGAASNAVRRLFGSGSVANLDYDTATFQVPIGNASSAMPAIGGSSGLKAHFEN
jgi:class 3 adenylate cyclase